MKRLWKSFLNAKAIPGVSYEQHFIDASPATDCPSRSQRRRSQPSLTDPLPQTQQPSSKTKGRLFPKYLSRTVSATDVTALLLANDRNSSDSKRKKSQKKRRAKVFGCPLTELPTAATVEVLAGDNVRCRVPVVIERCARFLLKEGISVIGVFRICGSIKRVACMQSMFDSAPTYGAEAELTCGGQFKVHDAASTMRRYLNELPHPVIHLDLYAAFRAAYEQHWNDEEAQVAAYKCLVKALPIPHRHLLRFLTNVLSEFATHSDTTLMTIENLAALFQPGILSHPNHSLDPGEYMRNQQIVLVLLKHSRALFDQQPPCRGITRTILCTRGGPEFIKSFASPSSSSTESTLCGARNGIAERRPKHLTRGQSMIVRRRLSLLDNSRSTASVAPVRRSVTTSAGQSRRTKQTRIVDDWKKCPDATNRRGHPSPTLAVFPMPPPR